MILLVLVALFALVLWYVMAGREWLKAKPWMAGFFAFVEPIEIWLYKKSETMLVGRLLWVGGLLVTAYDAIAMFAAGLVGFDLTPITSRVLSDVPADLQPLVVSFSFAGIGALIGWLRKRTTKPLELVEIAETDMKPEVAQAVAVADQAKVAAVAVVVEAKAEAAVAKAETAKEVAVEAAVEAQKTEPAGKE